MQQKTKTTATLDPEKDLKLEFDEKSILHEIQNIEAPKVVEEDDDEYTFSYEELDRRVKAAREDEEEGRCTPHDEKFEKAVHFMLKNVKNGLPYDHNLPEEFQEILRVIM